MLYLSGQQDKEVSYACSIHREQRYYNHLSAAVAFSHESHFHGPLFSTLAAVGPAAKRSRRWTLEAVIYTSLLMALEPSRALKDRFSHARQVVVEMFAGRKRPGKTYQGYVKARRQIDPKQRSAIHEQLPRHHRRIAGPFWRRDGWLAFSADGTRIEVPRTIKNEKAFGCAGRHRTGPQLSLTSLYHMGTGLPWAWQIGAGTESEQVHLRQRVASLPSGSLLVADAGFTSFDLLTRLLDHHVEFLVRMGSNRTLLTGLVDAKITTDGEVVWLWPTSRQAKHPPLMLRLIRIEQANQSPVYLLTSVMDQRQLTREQIGQFYRMRRGQEVFHRSFKRTLEQHKMRSGSAAEAQRELDWAMMAYLMIGLWTVEALIGANHDPLCWSVAESLRVVRQVVYQGARVGCTGRLEVLLRRAVKDSYVRKGSKQARQWPRKKKDHPPGPPRIREATEKEKHRAKAIYEKIKVA